MDDNTRVSEQDWQQVNDLSAAIAILCVGTTPPLAFAAFAQLIGSMHAITGKSPEMLDLSLECVEGMALASYNEALKKLGRHQ